MRAAPALALLLLAACGHQADQSQDLDSLDHELSDPHSVGNSRDPELAKALHDQIMVDPGLTQQSNANAIKPAPDPAAGGVPVDGPTPDPVAAASLQHAPAAGPCPGCKAKDGALTLRTLAAHQPDTARCSADVAYSAGWANRLPADLPLYPAARVTEAAGNDANRCRLRIVSFRTSAPPAKVVDWYYTAATKARYSAEHGTDGKLQVLGGTRGDDAYMVYAQAGPDGTEVDLVTNTGR